MEEEDDVGFENGLPVIPDESVVIVTDQYIDQTYLESTEDEYEIGLQKGDKYPILMSIPRGKSNSDEGISTYSSLVKLTSAEVYDWELSTLRPLDFEKSKETDEKTARDVQSPNYEEMEQLREQTNSRLDMVDTEEGREYILKRAWKEAGDIELEGIE